ncbi:hypothetical protein HUK65_04595 [Rhodobacteraceae bacterium 2376]|uniref:Uncharacterized protein n=1 Tax=Rhabdonatronobacter sediminivivens TaxID=2743469 RepID=A0A7Z0HXT8_9RHOB|nr:hypothetical protein [Rhabdonatronobacter sediminivivens]NYS24264.1 hypothetical protein [Rhabdonatronobacter sediminivivens]
MKQISYTLANLQTYDRANAALAAGAEALIPADHANRLQNGENALRALAGALSVRLDDLSGKASPLRAWGRRAVCGDVPMNVEIGSGQRCRGHG